MFCFTSENKQLLGVLTHEGLRRIYTSESLYGDYVRVHWLHILDSKTKMLQTYNFLISLNTFNLTLAYIYLRLHIRRPF